MSREDGDAIVNRVVQKQNEEQPKPIPMLLWCPLCNGRHVDKGIYAVNPHKIHACQGCGHLWQPAMLATVGVQYLPGCKDDEEEKDETAEQS